MEPENPNAVKEHRGLCFWLQVRFPYKALLDQGEAVLLCVPHRRLPSSWVAIVGPKSSWGYLLTLAIVIATALINAVAR